MQRGLLVGNPIREFFPSKTVSDEQLAEMALSSWSGKKRLATLLYSNLRIAQAHIGGNISNIARLESHSGCATSNAKSRL
jgi:hypothetical protein